MWIILRRFENKSRVIKRSWGKKEVFLYPLVQAHWNVFFWLMTHHILQIQTGFFAEITGGISMGASAF